MSDRSGLRFILLSVEARDCSEQQQTRPEPGWHLPSLLLPLSILWGRACQTALCTTMTLGLCSSL